MTRMKHEWMRLASGIVDGAAYEKRGMYDSRTTSWRETLESECIDYRAILDQLRISSDIKAAFYAYAINGCSLEAIATHFHVGASGLKKKLKSVMEELMLMSYGQ